MDLKDFWELLSAIVTALGLPFAILVYVADRRKAREVEEEEVNELLAAAYTDFLKLVIDNPDLKLRSPDSTRGLNPEQQDRMRAMFEILTSLFERAFLLTYEENLTGKKLRRWLSWEDFMREWVRRDDFRESLPAMLPGEGEGDHGEAGAPDDHAHDPDRERGGLVRSERLRRAGRAEQHGGCENGDHREHTHPCTAWVSFAHVGAGAPARAPGRHSTRRRGPPPVGWSLSLIHKYQPTRHRYLSGLP